MSTEINNEILVTQAGYDAMLAKLAEEEENQKEITERIKDARSFGDLSENSEYEEARRDQGIVAGRIADLKSKINRARIVSDDEVSTDTVGIGSVVKVHNISRNKVFEYRIVGSTEADVKNGKLSNESPVGKGLIGAKAGDTVTIEVPAGIVEYEVLEISR
ncbi:MAG: transcription elongation factor GreA [Eubacteriaceae bacterium]|nr:transcription elongation factor GreA [Eubacteriaceae bacterium]